MSAKPPAPPEPPARQPPSRDWPHFELFCRVKDALASLPGHFRSETVISGINATDIFTLNAALGATIEEQVVESLNNAREIWDPQGRYRMYEFTRQAQTFPDVLLRRFAPDPGEPAILMGIELKGWYLLAKEGEPSFRFQVTPSACNPQDLIVVVPWVLANVLSGSPKAFRPYIELARYAAEHRNYHWQHVREAKKASTVRLATGVTPYPRKSDRICDEPASDAGGNFGRFARTGIMDSYLEEARCELVRGIEARHWLTFFKAFQDNASSKAIEAAIERAARAVAESQAPTDRAAHVETILAALRALVSG
ncbi:MAG: hypothetical protein FJ291_10005 [Planctomycetes bacterium]|nr:hypothetical protein [Planctomycetota bacterium]